MSAITHEYIDVAQLEMDALSKSLTAHLIDSTYAILYIAGQTVAMYFSTKSLLNNILKEVESSETIIDDDQLVDRLEWMQNTAKDSYHKLGDFLKAGKSINPLDRIFFPLSRWLLRKIFNNLGLVITNITEHDVDVEDSYSESFDSVEDLIRHLNS
jgi:hypothetical protein